jgi:ribosomal protein L21
MAEDGVVALRQAIAVTAIDALCAKMLDDLAHYAELYEIDNNFQGVRPPPFQPFLFPEIIFNEPAITISRAILGPGATLSSYGANTAFTGSQPQVVHADAVPPQPGPYGPCTLLVVNVPLVDVTEENGATIYWPGTHHDTRLHSGNRFPTEEMIAEWEAKRPAERALTHRGDLVLRDMRVWHGGMPNRTPTHRPMLALVHRHTKPEQGTFEAEAGSEMKLPIMLLSDDSGAVTVGRPIVEGREITAQVIGDQKGEKLVIFKYHPKKRYRKKTGHRQNYTKIRIIG